MTTTSETQSDRFVGIDIARYVAFIAVVTLHTWTTASFGKGPTALGIIDHAARFAVPFFFIVSGYFAAGREIDVWSAIWKVCRRLLPVYLFWIAVYLLLSGHPSDYTHGVVGSLRTLANGGAGFHLWFLPSLGFGLSAMLLTQRYLGYRGIIALGLALYAIGLCVGSYRAAIGLPGEASRAGPLFAFGFVALGFWLRDHRIVLSAKFGGGLAAAGFALQLTEAWLLNATGNAPFAPHNFLIGTVPFGLGVFACCLQARPTHSLAGRLFASLGQKSFGMYCIHVLFIWLFVWMLVPTDMATTFTVFVFVATCSTVTIYVASFVRILRPLIR